MVRRIWLCGYFICLANLAHSVEDNVVQSLEIVRSLTWSPAHVKAEQIVFQTQEEMGKVWVADGGKKEDLPQVDFDEEMVLAVFGGEKPTSDFEIKLEAIIENSAHRTKVYVIFREITPENNKPRPVARSYPVQVAVLKRSGPVEFVNVDSERGRDIERLFDVKQRVARKRATDWVKKNGKTDWGEIVKVEDSGGNWVISFERQLNVGTPIQHQAAIRIDKESGKIDEILGE